MILFIYQKPTSFPHTSERSKASHFHSLHLFLDRKLSSLGLGKRLLVLAQPLSNLAIAVILHNPGRVANEQGRVNKTIDLAPDRLEELGLLDALEQVVLATLLLDDGASLVGQDADLLVGVLAGDAVLGELHEDGLGSHEGQLLVDAGADDLGVDDEAVSDVVEGEQDGVGQQEHLGDVHAADGAVVERALEPLRLEGVAEVNRQVGQLAGEGGDAL